MALAGRDCKAVYSGKGPLPLCLSFDMFMIMDFNKERVAKGMIPFFVDQVSLHLMF